MQPILFMSGKKTKAGAIGLAAAGVLNLAYPTFGYVSESIAMFSLALCFYGLYDRHTKDNNDLRRRIKKPILRG